MEVKMEYLIPPYYRLVIQEDGVVLYSDSVSKKGKAMTPTPDSNGYLTYTLQQVDGGKKTVKEHRLVAEAVYGPCPEDMQINHKDGIKINNRPDNLEYVTLLGNMQHSYRIGLRPIRYGTDAPNYRHGQYGTKEYWRLKSKEKYARLKQRKESYLDFERRNKSRLGGTN